MAGPPRQPWEQHMPIMKGTRKHRKVVRRRSDTPIKSMRMMTHAERVDALRGKYAFVHTSSEEFIARKRAEMEKEDRHCPPS